VQALPIVVVRNKSGDVLCLRRRERKEENALHEKLVLWAGGHVRREDGGNGTAIVRGALRELNEELRLNVEANEVRLLGAIYTNTGRSSKHVAIVYEWKAPSDDVEIALCSIEFAERRGNSLSGRFFPINNLPKELTGDSSEAWSFEIIRELLPEVSIKEPSLY
jgi:predicted NUDIX family phosphoesterase